MADQTIYYYKVWCDTDSQWEYIWSEVTPTVCPANNGHTIDSSKIVIVDIIKEEEVIVREEGTPTGGHFQAKTILFDDTLLDGSSGWKEVDISFPYPISLLSCDFVAQADDEGNELQFIVAPNTTVGAITANVDSLENVINVQQSVVDNVSKGYVAYLYDGVNSDYLGPITDITGTVVTTKNNTVNSFSAATPTYFQMSIFMGEDITIPAAGRYALGESKIGGSYIPAETIIRARYNNISQKTGRFGAMIEYLY